MNANPIDGAYVAIVHPYVAYDLMRSADWIDVHKYADPESLFTGELGKLGGVRFVESTEAKIIGPADIFPGVPRLTLKNSPGFYGQYGACAQRECFFGRSGSAHRTA